MKYLIIHHSNEFICSPYFKFFKSKKQSLEYIKNFTGNYRHNNDSLLLVEILNKYQSIKINNNLNIRNNSGEKNYNADVIISNDDIKSETYKFKKVK